MYTFCLEKVTMWFSLDDFKGKLVNLLGAHFTPKHFETPLIEYTKDGWTTAKAKAQLWYSIGVTFQNDQPTDIDTVIHYLYQIITTTNPYHNVTVMEIVQKPYQKAICVRIKFTFDG